jgi:hypothetical protein
MPFRIYVVPSAIDATKSDVAGNLNVRPFHSPQHIPCIPENWQLTCDWSLHGNDDFGAITIGWCGRSAAEHHHPG